MLRYRSNKSDVYMDTHTLCIRLDKVTVHFLKTILYNQRIPHSDCLQRSVTFCPLHLKSSIPLYNLAEFSTVQEA